MLSYALDAAIEDVINQDEGVWDQANHLREVFREAGHRQAYIDQNIRHFYKEHYKKMGWKRCALVGSKVRRRAQ